MKTIIFKAIQTTAIAFIMFMLLLVCSSRATEPGDYVDAASLEMMAWNWQLECNCSTDLDGPLDRCIEELAEANGITVNLTRLSKRQYTDRLMIDFQNGNAADIIWVSGNNVTDLAGADFIIPLHEVMEEKSFMIENLSDDILETFFVDGTLYGIPLGAEGEPARHGYAITRNAMERGRITEALEVIAFMQERVPARGKADLVISNFEVDSDSFLQGEPLTVTAEVKNIGDDFSEETMMHFVLDNEIIDERPVDYLDPGESRTYQLRTELPLAGMHDYAAITDLDGLVEENNNLNNTGSSGGMYHNTGSFASPPKRLGNPILIRKDAFKINISEYYRRYPNIKVGFDGTNYLVVWSQQVKPFKNEYNHYLMGVRISPNGKIIDTIPIEIMKSPGNIGYFNMAFDGTNYLVVWQKVLGLKQFQAGLPLPDPYSVIQAARVSKAGILLDKTPINIENTPCQYNVPAARNYEVPDVAFTGTNFLVVYRSGIFGGPCYNDGVDARFVTPTGAVSAKTNLLTFPGQIDAVNMQRLAFNPAQQEGFLLFDATDYAPTPYQMAEAGIWIKIQGGTVSASPLHVITKAPYQPVNPNYFFPAIAADGKGNYFGTFESSAPYSKYAMYINGCLVGPMPGKTSSFKQAMAKGWVIRPDIAYDGKNYTLVYEKVLGCGNIKLAAVRVAPNGTWSSEVCYKSMLNLVGTPAVTFGNTNGLVAFTVNTNKSSNAANNNFHIYATFIDKSK